MGLDRDEWVGVVKYKDGWVGLGGWSEVLERGGAITYNYVGYFCVGNLVK